MNGKSANVEATVPRAQGTPGMLVPEADVLVRPVLICGGVGSVISCREIKDPGLVARYDFCMARGLIRVPRIVRAIRLDGIANAWRDETAMEMATAHVVEQRFSAWWAALPPGIVIDQTPEIRAETDRILAFPTVADQVAAERTKFVRRTRDNAVIAATAKVLGFDLAVLGRKGFLTISEACEVRIERWDTPIGARS